MSLETTLACVDLSFLILSATPGATKIIFSVARHESSKNLSRVLFRRFFTQNFSALSFSRGPVSIQMLLSQDIWHSDNAHFWATSFFTALLCFVRKLENSISKAIKLQRDSSYAQRMLKH